MVADHGKKEEEASVWQEHNEDTPQRNSRIVCDSLRLIAPIKRFYNEKDGHTWRTTTKLHTTLLSAVADGCVTLSISPFPGRQPTIVFLPYDRPWDGDPDHGNELAYVEPVPHVRLPQSSLLSRKVVERHGAYARLRFTISDKAVRFSALMRTLERAGFTEEVSLLSKTWSLKWCKHPLRSDFAQLKSFQRINHFPGTWRLGKKDHLHKNLVAAQQRWSEGKSDGSSSSNSGGSDDKDHNHINMFGNFFPDGWVLPDDEKLLRSVLCSSRERGNLFIVKPTLEACGRGIYLFKANEHVNLPCISTQSSLCSDVSSRRSPRFIVQRYIQDPLLIEGYKFDLRLYVVVTSYAPLRAYLYDEGLVRFATSPYYSTTERQSETDMISINNLTAHLTNFTINKKSDDFVSPTGLKDEEEGVCASKWMLATLKEYFYLHGLNWNGTMARINDLLVKTLLAVEPHVIEEMNAFDGDVGSCCFEVYGVDVLLRRPEMSYGLTPVPTLMEVNIMPSLSTHYSLLDQCVKGNFIADLLTLVGVSAADMSRKRQKKTVIVSELNNDGHSTFSYGHPFLDALTDVFELEACLTAEEERMRCTHFQSICPTPESFSRYRALFSQINNRDQRRSLNEVLSMWEQAKLNTPPLYNFV